MAYLDTSVLGSYYCPETLSAAVNRALAALPAPAISPLVDVEFCSLLALKVRQRELTRAAAQKALAQFRQHLSDGYYQSLEIGAREYDIARTWLAGFNTPLRTLDALHLACAHAHGRTLWTTDKPLAQAAHALGVNHRLLKV
ncbi:MAG: type II toxin-antitoxin system VapC family toxin [Phycisphaerales bacterium]|nr:type II toxin-antitoxin system VapC family toxin [Phycisphaerales bacterium]